jgi:hypothetical protein
MAHNIDWEVYLIHIAIYDVKITLQLVGGWSTSCGDFRVTIGGSSS